MSKFNIYNSKKGYYFTLTNTSGTNVVTSKYYTRKHDAKRGIESTINALNDGNIVDNTRGKRFKFTVNSKKNKVLGTSKTWGRSSDLTKAITRLTNSDTCFQTVDMTK
jgi:uncharacterized protein YegP (UPF0339 family)